MTEPWHAASIETEAARWLETGDIALRPSPTRGRSSVSGGLTRILYPTLQTDGRASVSASLSIAHVMRVAPIAGITHVAGLIGDLYEIAGSSAGSSQVLTQAMWFGKGHVLEGAATGKSTPGASLTVTKYSRIAGGQAGDAGGQTVREDGPTRRRFTPVSIGRVND